MNEAILVPGCTHALSHGVLETATAKSVDMGTASPITFGKRFCTQLAIEVITRLSDKDFRDDVTLGLLLTFQYCCLEIE